MSNRANPLRIGAFLLGGLALLVLAVFFISGGRWLERQDRVIMNFRGSTFGLQVGAPVVFRGVRIGTVQAIGIQYDAAHLDYAIPVTADLERDALERLRGPDTAGAARGLIPALVARGLRAQLGMQSLLTGQLYVDLDLRPQRESLQLGSAGDLPEIPTTATAIQALKGQLEGLDVKKLVDDVASIAAAAKSLVERPQLAQSFDNVAQITSDIRRLTQGLDRRFDRLAGNTEATLRTTRRGLEQVSAAADRVGSAADRLSATAGKVDAALSPQSQMMRSAQRSLDELSGTLAALRSQASGDSDLMRNADQALRDVSRASRAVQDLSETLERQPQALIRGRAPASALP